MLVVGGGMLSLLTGVGGALSDRGRETPEGEREGTRQRTLFEVKTVKTATTNHGLFPDVNVGSV